MATTLIGAGITAVLAALVTALATYIVSWALGIAFDISSSIMAPSTFSFKLTDIFNMLPDIGIDYRGLFSAVGYSILIICVVLSVLKAISAPITGSQTKNPAEYVIKGIVTVIIMVLLFGIGKYEGLINLIGEQMNMFMDWATKGFLGSDGKLAITSSSIVSQVQSATGTDGTNILNPKLTGTGKVAGLVCIIFSIAICAGCVQAAITYVERYLSFALYLAVGPVCIGFSASDETKGTTLDWLKGVFSQFLTIMISVLCWRMFFVQVVKDWTYFNLVVCLGFLSLIKNSEKIVNMMGLKTMASGESARAFGGAFRTATNMAKDLQRMGHTAAHHAERDMAMKKQAEDKYIQARLNAKSDADIDAAKRTYSNSSLLGKSDKAMEKTWDSFKKKAGINDGITGEYGLSNRKADKIKQDYDNKVGGYNYKNASGFSNYKQFQNDLAKAENHAKKMEAGELKSTQGLSPEERKQKADDYRNRKYNEASKNLTPQGRALKNEIDAVNAAGIKERNEGLRGINKLSPSQIAQEDGIKTGATARKPLSQETMQALERNMGASVAGKKDSADNSTVASLKTANSFGDVRKAVEQRKASYQSADSAYNDPDMPMPALKMSDDESKDIQRNLDGLHSQAITNAHGDGEKIMQANQEYAGAYRSVFGASDSSDREIQQRLQESSYIPKAQSDFNGSRIGADGNKISYSQLSTPLNCSSPRQQAINSVNDVLAGNSNYVSGGELASAFGLDFDKSLMIRGGVAGVVDNPNSSDGNQTACIMADVYDKDTGQSRLMAIMPNNESLAAGTVVMATDENLASQHLCDTSKEGMQLCEGTDGETGFFGTYIDNLLCNDEDELEKDDNLHNVFNYHSQQNGDDSNDFLDELDDDYHEDERRQKNDNQDEEQNEDGDE